MEEYKANESFEEAKINKFLKNFGSIPDEPKKPRFRLVWSEFQHEKRLGEFEIYNGPIFIRTETGVKEVEKYPYINCRYILEQWYPPELAYTPEIPDSRYGSYEPIYVFESGKGDRLPLRLDVVQIIMYSKFNTSESELAKISRRQAEEDKKSADTLEYFEDALDLSAMQSLLHHKEAALVPMQYDVTSPNLRNIKKAEGN